MISVLVGFLLLGSSSGLILDQKGQELINEYIDTISKAKSMTVEVEAVQGGNAAIKAKLTVAKPAQVRVETPGRVRIIDGQNYTDCHLAKSQYATRKVRGNDMADLLASDLFMAWSPILRKAEFASVAKTAAYDGTDKVDGKTFDIVKVTVDAKASKTARLYVDPDDHLVKHVEVQAGRDARLLILSNRVELGGVDNKEVAFAIPPGMTQVDETDLIGVQWYYDLNAALEAAQKANKLVMVDFYTDWCHWCKELDDKVYSQPDFWKEAKNFILAKVNAEKGAGVDAAKQYGVNAYPTIKFLDSQGNVVHEIEGYMPLDAFLAEMRAARGG